MGVDSRKAPPLPAPTETESTTSPTELTTATELSKLGDEKSAYSLPEDGTPVTIRTRGHKANRSQTSLLIEYFEGGKSGSSSGRKPSVRVRLTPSSKKGRGDHIQLTETKGSRKASLTRRIPLDDALGSRDIDFPDGDDGLSMTSYASATEESNVSRNPIDIEIDRSHRRRRPSSPLIPSGERESYQPGNPSEISAIPSDSFLDGSGPGLDLKRGSSPFRGESLIGAATSSAIMDETRSSKTRSGGKDRVKISERPKEKAERKRRPKSRASSVSEYQGDDIHSPRRRPSRSHADSHISAIESSVMSSNVSQSHRSVDARSMRSGMSKSSINNPKLLETVEDAIRRLILPELSALKREQSQRESRRESLTSTGTSISRDEASRDRRRSSGQRGETRDTSSKPKERRNREARHDYDETSMHSPSHDSIDGEYQTNEANNSTPKRSNDLLKAAAAGAAGLALTKGLAGSKDDQSETGERKQRERRRRRTESARSRSVGRDRYAEEYDDEEPPAPPMPLMSDINPSEMTRTSILSAESDGPHSASEELVSGQVKLRAVMSADSTPTPSRTPIDFPPPLGASHANVSHGDLTALPRGKKEYVEAEEYENDEYGRPISADRYGEYEEHTREISDPGDYPEDGYDDSYYATQDVPPPLRYVPYQAGARGLSPIPSVSGYTEAGSEAPLPRNSMHSTSDVPSPPKSPHRLHHRRSMESLDSAPSNLRTKEFDHVSADGQRNTMYSDDSHLGSTAEGQAVRGLGANPKFVNPLFGAESAVASLIDGSMLEQSVMTGASGYDYSVARDSNISYDDQSKVQSSRGMSPEKMSLDDHREYEEERQQTPGARSLAQSQDYSEYEIDEHGRKIPRTKYRHSPTSSEAAITAGAVGAAAAALKAAQERKQATVEETSEVDFQPAGVFRNRSFKERAMDGWQPRNTPTHSVDRLDFESDLKMTASSIPDPNEPLPEFQYGDDEDFQTNPSLLNERLDAEDDHHGGWSGRATPTQYGTVQYEQDMHMREGTPKDGGLGITEVAGAAALGAAVGMAATHSREPSQDPEEWRRTSEDRKRDTLVTNPFEDTSPMANPALNENLMGARGLGSSYNAPFNTGSPGFQKYDEGYMSNGPNRTPDIAPVGKALDFSGANNPMGVDDPFYVNKDNPRHLSGMSQGMGSPFYEAATGAGIERIENKDIVALLQHLMVRDAQRSARDTEIVALLMNAALEMRNSFREMKDFVQDTGDDVIFANVENTEKLQKSINGPRPYPGNTARSIQSGSVAGTIDDIATKKKNLWRRALQGLSTKGTNDLSRIEDMLMQLLGEVDVLKTQTAPPASSGPGQSYENLQLEAAYDQDKGYEPEGVSTASRASPSGHLSVPQGQLNRHFSDHRISTVQENEEEYEYEPHPSPSAERTMMTNAGVAPFDSIQRGGSVPLEPPPLLAVAAQDQMPLSADNTPRSDKGKKHKSSGSTGWLPKISRWSGTTTSSIGRVLLGGSSKKDTKHDGQPPSRSGSSMASFDDAYRHDPYGEDKLHSNFSQRDLAPAQDMGSPDLLDPPMPTYLTPEDAKYQVHRNSLNLQHPQPRPGQTERFRNALEYSAEEYDAPATPRSADWAGSATSLNRLHSNTNRGSITSSAAPREAERYLSSPTQQAGSSRPPKESIGSSSSVHTPPRSTRVSKLQKNSPMAPHSYESGYGSATGTYVSQYTGSSPKLENRNLNGALGAPARRPSGPRAMTPKSPEEDMAREERRRKRGM